MNARLRRRVMNVVWLTVVLVPAGWFGLLAAKRYLVERELAGSWESVAGLRDEVVARGGMSPTQPGGDVSLRKWQLQEGPDIARTLGVLEVMREQSGVQMDSVKVPKAGNADRQSFTLTGVGTPEQVCMLLSLIEGNNRLIVVETQRLANDPERGMTFEIGVTTFH